MSIKDLFGKRSNQIVTIEKYKETVERDGESVEHVEEKGQEKARFIPRSSIDFDDPKTFARYGSAEKYYVDAINSVLNTYPYDGSLAEKTAWHNQASYVDNYIFENEYPRVTGYLSFNTAEEQHPVSHNPEGYRYLSNPQFIYVKGGPNPTPANPTGELRREYPEGLGKANIWNPDFKRESNLYASGATGNTVEFWFKLDEERESISGRSCLFDLWNNQEFGSDKYSRFLIEMPEDPASNKSIFEITYVSGSFGVDALQVLSRESLSDKFDINQWNHFAFSVVNSDSSLYVRSYLNGKLVDEKFAGTPIGDFVGETNHLTATINSLQYKNMETEQNLYGAGSCRASYDEFRFWKEVQSSESIGRQWFTQTHGGTNTDQANTDLGVYFKFNEGIFDADKISPVDRQVLDYSGRISNGAIVNFSLDVRQLGSAINSYPGVKNTEKLDPIMYREHPLVKELIETKRLEGSSHDFSNNAAIYNTMPEWITTADEQLGGQNLLNLSQIVASYFDTLHLQIEALPSISNTHYAREGEKPLPFTKKLLESVGFVAPEIFVDTTILEALMNRNEERVFEEKLHEIKALIYQNIYNNISGIYKAKGTEKAFRNLLRCFGVGDELVKINLYGDGARFKLENNYKSVSVKKNYLDFNDPDRHDSTVYQQKQPENPDSTSYISGSELSELDFIPFTAEASVIFPKKKTIDHPKYVPTDFGFTDDKPSSLFGMHQALADETDLSWVDDPDFGFRVVAVKQSELSRDAKFRLDLRGFGTIPNSDNGYFVGHFETDYFYDVYDNTRWNFAVRVITDKSPNLVYKSDEDVKYYLEFYGVSTILDEVEEEFLLKSEIPAEIGKKVLNSNKRMFLGAEYPDFNDNSSGPLNKSDVKIGEVRFWQDYLDNETITLHSQDPDNYGVKDPYKPAYFNQTSVTRRVPQIDTLCLYWDFATVTLSSVSDGTDEAGNILSDSFFYVDDVSYGNQVQASPDGRYEWLGRILKKQHTGKGDYYYPEDRNVVDRNFLFAAKQNLPEIIGSSDTIKILTQDDEFFYKNTKPINYFFSIEKSMYQSISQEIVEVFAGIKSFNNLIGEPVNRYRLEYKNLNKLRQLFFQRFKNEPKIERYVQFYKWIDSSIGEMLSQLIPASANFSDGMRTMIESHILERNKYWTKFPTLEMNQKPPEAPLLGINEMLYNWRNGHATFEEGDNCLWWKDRAERTDLLSSGDPDVDSSKEDILDAIMTKNSGDHTTRSLSYKALGTSKSYQGQTFALRSLSTPYRFSVDMQDNIHSGVNNKRSKNIDFVRAELADDKTSKIKVEQSEPFRNYDCDDDLAVKHPLLNRRLNTKIDDKNGRNFSLYEINENLVTGEKYWNSNHSDTYGDDKERPAQGVFTEALVGGLQSRHVPLNRGDDTRETRPEAWYFTTDGDSGEFSAVPSDKPSAKYYRGEKAKRPVNIKNVKASYGNYRLDYQVVQTSSRSLNNRWMIEQEGLDVEKTHSTASPYVLGLYDFLLPERGRNEHIFTERFSSPGSPDTLSRGMLDVEAEEFGVYNNLNFRNLDVRLHLKNWLTYHTKRFGYRSYYRGVPVEDCNSPGDTDVFCEANFHKNHRNTAYRPEPYDYIEHMGRDEDVPQDVDNPCCECDSDDGEYAEGILSDYRCKEIRDNFWITHQLPRSGYQYSWIAASTQREIFEEVDGEAKFYRVCPWGYSTDYPNAVAYHPEIVTSPTEKVGDISAYSKMVVKKSYYKDSDSSLMYERVNIEQGFPFLNRFLKKQGESHPSTYEVIADEMPLESCSETFEGSVTTGLDVTQESTYELLESGDVTLNDILLHRDGPYQHPSWRQIRGYENPVIVKGRKKNIISNITLPKMIRVESNSSRFADDRVISFRERRSQDVVNYIEPSVSWNMPMRTKLQFSASPSSGTIVHSYSNNLEVFSNPYLDKRIGLQKTAKQVYDVLVEKYVDPTTSYSPRLFEVVYSEYIFPKHRNAGLDKVRRRKFYKEYAGPDGYDARSSDINTFWEAHNLRERTPLEALGATNYPERRSSVWALEYRDDGQSDALRGDLVASSQAQIKGYVTEGYTSYESQEENEFAWVAPRPRLQFIHNPRGGSDYSEKPWVWKASELSSNQPWYDNYDEYSKDVRLIGQNFSLTPEFNISTHMSYYVNQNSGNFKAENKNILELPGVGKKLSKSSLSASSSLNYFSWDGSTILDETPGEPSFRQPNFADGWQNYLTGQHRFLGSGWNFDGDERKMSELSPVVEPTPIDKLALGLSSWTCAEPYSVFNFRKELFLGSSFAHSVDIDFENTPNRYEIDLPEGVSFRSSLMSGLRVGLSGTIDWTQQDTINDPALLDRWQNTALLSFWVKLDQGRGESHGLFSMLSNSVTHTPYKPLERIGGTVESLRADVLQASRLRSDRLAEIDKLDKLLQRSSSPYVKSSIESKKIQIENDIKKLADKSRKALVNLESVYREEDLFQAGKPIRSDFYVDSEDSDGNYVDAESGETQRFGDLFWIDNIGNKLVFRVSKERLLEWNNISVYYVGGGLPAADEAKSLDSLSRVIVFLNGERLQSRLIITDDNISQIFSNYDDDVLAFDGSLMAPLGAGTDTVLSFKDLNFGACRNTPMNGQATDLMLFRGNPGITKIEETFDGSDERYQADQINVGENRWFFDRNSPDYYARLNEVEVFSTLCETITEKQCQDANEIYEDWREKATICNRLTKVPVIPAGALIKPEDLFAAYKGLSFSTAFPPQETAASESWVDSFPLETPSLSPTTPIHISASDLSIIGSAVEPAQSEVQPELPPTKYEDSENSRCSELIGWWRLGIPRWERQTCEEYVWNEDFFKCYSHTDKLEHIDKVLNDHRSLAGEGSTSIMRLEVDGVKKLLPYNGFYPSQRAVQLGALFYDSVIPFVEGENDSRAFDRARTEQAALQPFFAPGILFNTIKSGIAVDWAAYSGTYGDELRTIIQRYNPEEKITPILAVAVADDLRRAEALGRVSNSVERSEYIRKSFNRNANFLAAELKQVEKEAKAEATQVEYEKYALSVGLSPEDPKTAEKFKNKFSLQEFEPNKSILSDSKSSRVRSILDTGTETSLSSSVRKALDALGNSDLAYEKVSKYLDSNRLSVSSARRTRHKYSTNGMYIDQPPSFRIPFEGLLSLQSYVPQMNSSEESKIFFLAPSYYESISKDVEYKYPYFEWSGDKNPLYEMAMSNFLAEVPNFFLKEGKFTTFASAPENKFKTVKEGWTYYMDVHLYKTDDFDMTISLHDGELKTVGADISGSSYTTNGRYFGPALRYFPTSDVDAGGETYIAPNKVPASDPAQAPYVPPYFYGRAKARLSFKAQRSGQPTLEEILNNLEIEYINEEMDELFSSRSSSEKYIASSIFKTALGLEQAPWKDTPAYLGRMPMDACIKFDGRVNEKKTSFAAKNTAYDFSPDGVSRLAPTQVEDDKDGTGVWVISPRFECPTFNFRTQENLNYREENSCGTGIWGGYGSIPVERGQKEQGLFISIEESFKKHESARKPIKCVATEEEIFSVALGVTSDVRNVNENVIQLQDPYGEVYNITIGQPSDSQGASNISSWNQRVLSSDVKSIIKCNQDLPYLSNSCIRTIATSPESTLEDPLAGMAGEYDIEAYLQAESILTDVFSLYSSPTEKVPSSADVANAITYHINFLYETDTSFPWRATIAWVNRLRNLKVEGSCRDFESTNRRKEGKKYNRNINQLSAIVEIEYDSERRPSNLRTADSVSSSPKVSLYVNQDSIKNPRGVLGIRYLTTDSALDFGLDTNDPQTQTDREFYKKTGTKTIFECIETVGSLIDVCGFTATKSRIGEVSPSKEISEAVVMIPFVDNPVDSKTGAPTVQISGRNYFQISKRLFEETKANVNAGLPAIRKDGVYDVSSDIGDTSVSELIKKMQKYNLPPQFDFFKYKDINPFVMYIFEFTETLDSQDLSNIWQGLMPERSRVAERQVVSIEHEMNEINFFEGKRVPENIRWMVFRVKRKAKTNYWEMTADSVDDDRFKFDFKFGSNSTPEYNYNWPYDFCSLVELCKIKGGVSVSPKASELRTAVSSEPITSDEEKRKLIDDAHAASGTPQTGFTVGLFNTSEEDE